ncbi:MAG: carbamoyl-phosphate synthase large subunit, partial [Kofleriaceae bacterium]|nr:carbamoyl-phosphate synthase large subunit [Kofleriaceae bacterium]
VVVKMPRFTFEKFPDATAVLGTQMKSVGEAMSMAGSFQEALGKAVRSLETGRAGFDLDNSTDLPALERELTMMGPDRIYQLAQAFRLGLSLERANTLTHIDPWFLQQLHTVIMAEVEIAELANLSEIGPTAMRGYKRLGLSDARIANLITSSEEAEVRALRHSQGIRPVYKRVDTCAAEFAADTPYMYSTYEEECESAPTDKRKVIILGGGPNRIGQGIEFDYCCVHAVMALREMDIEAIMVNCNPETVSTDYDTSDRLYFEPLTLEDVLEICHVEKPDGVILQFGGQTPLKLASALSAAGIPLLGTSADAIDRAEDRERFGEVMRKLDLRAPAWGIARTIEEAQEVARDIGYPVMVRPSYVLGGRAMERVYDDSSLAHYFKKAEEVGLPVLVDQFLSDAIELDIDVVADQSGDCIVGGVMEHIEEAGIHSGDSACSLPAYSLADETIDEIKRQAKALARELGVIGLMNMQVAVLDGDTYIIEVNPRASRTVPFVSKAVGIPLAKVAAQVMLGKTLKELKIVERVPTHVSVKESVFPFVKFDSVDTILGPEMRSTGEVMGVDSTFGHAFAKAQEAAGNQLPTSGTAFLSLRDADKKTGCSIAKGLSELGFALLATGGTAAYFRDQGLEVQAVNKVLEGHPHCVDSMVNGEVQLVINTTEGKQAVLDSHSLRRTALTTGISYFTTIRGANAALSAITATRTDGLRVQALQRYHN